MRDPYTSDLTGLSIPEHDRLEGTFGTPTRDRRVGQVFVLFDRNQKIIKIYDNEAAAIRASESRLPEITSVTCAYRLIATTDSD
jgi:hypothetical protein